MTNLERWRFYHESVESPQVYIDWTFYATVSACLQRRVWWGRGHVLFPNLYIIFIGRPGLGKSIAAKTSTRIISSFASADLMKDGKLMKASKSAPIKIAPESMTPEYLLMYMADNRSTIELKKGGEQLPRPGTSHASIAIFKHGELGTLINHKDSQIITNLTEGYDGENFSRCTKTQGNNDILNPCIALLGTATPNWVREVVDTRILKEGFSSRVIFVYANKKRKQSWDYSTTPEQDAALNELRNHLQKIIQPTFYGSVKVSDTVNNWMKEWYFENDEKPLNKDKNLESYYARKKIHLMKLIMCMHFSEYTDFEITVDDCEKALILLNENERTMHLALAGAGKNDQHPIAEDIIHYLYKNKKATRRELIRNFMDQAPQHDLIAILDTLLEVDRIEATMKDGSVAFKISESEREIYEEFSKE